MIPFVDGHLDLALNALMLRRELHLSVDQVREKEKHVAKKPFDTCTVTYPALKEGGAVMVLSTVLARTRPWRVTHGEVGGAIGDFPDQDTAHAAAMAQWDYYQCQVDRGRLKWVLGRADLPDVSALNDGRLPDDAPLPLLLTMEGADPVRDPDDLHRWFEKGLRTIMLAHFGRSTYAHGTPDHESPDPPRQDVDGPLTDAGRRLLKEVAALKMPLDLTHLADTSMAEALDVFDGPVYASHCACRALNPEWQRNLPDDMIREIARRGGVIGMILHSPYLVQGFTPQTPREKCGLDDVVDHLEHLREVMGSEELIAIGSDMDGGYGLEFTPTGVETSAAMPNLAARMQARGWSEDAVRGVFAGNWLRFWGEHLPA